MYRLWAENTKSEKIELTDSPYYDILEIDGLLPEQAQLSTSALSNTDGSVINSARIPDRPISLSIKPKIPVEINRQRLYRFFQTKKQTTLYFQNENRDVQIAGIVQNFDGSLFEQSQIIIISLLCPFPFFEDRQTVYIDMSSTEDLFEFPFAIDSKGVEFSRIEKMLSQEIYNAGDVEAPLTIELTASGSVVNPIIYNVETREFFGIDITMQLGDVIRITTGGYNKKIQLIRNGKTTNAINYIRRGNKWFKLSPGYNTFTYQCDSGAEFLNIKFIYSNLYEGV